MMRRGPDFMIIGAMKCATSALHEQLARHPQFFMSTPKEPNFFSDDAEYARGIDHYASLFEGSPSSILCGESSTHYTKLPTWPRTVERIQKHFDPGSLRFIYVMRHPVDRLVSHFIHEWTQGEMTGPIDRAVRKWPTLIDYGRYAMQLAPYREAFGPEAILPVFQPRLLSDPQPEFERICRFLGAPGEARWRSDLGPVNASSRRDRQSRFRSALVNLPGADALKRALPDSVKNPIKSIWRMKKRPRLEGEALQMVEAMFDEDLARLGEWLGVDLNCANFNEVATRSEALEWRSPRAQEARR